MNKPTPGMLGISFNPNVPGSIDKVCVAIGMMFGRSREETMEELRKADEWLAWRDRDPKGFMKAHIKREKERAERRRGERLE